MSVTGRAGQIAERDGWRRAGRVAVDDEETYLVSPGGSAGMKSHARTDPEQQKPRRSGASEESG
jgi:hypothetical protein